jgi:diguanylate cyclase (GGDEF)-like protein/PAS domain S-box-containing protein
MTAHQGALEFLAPITKTTIHKFLDQYSSGVLFIDETGVILFANRRLSEIIETSAHEIVGAHFDDLFSAEGIAFNEIRDSDDNLTTAKRFETSAVKKEGGSVPVMISCNRIHENGLTLFLCTIDDISQQIELQQKLYQQTITDPLTGIFNRRYFDEQLAMEFTRATRYRRPFSVIIIDIDGFKQANDMFGHPYGDRMLQKATESFQRVLRQGDTVYRYGGDEFALILPETAREGAIEVTDRLKEMFSRYVHGEEKRIRLSLSIGIANYPEDGNDEKELIGAADRRMYLSKESGGNMITAHDSLNYLSEDTETLLRSLGNLAHLIEKSRGLCSNGLNHSQGLRTLAIEIGYMLGLSQKRLSLLEQASMLHDIGAIYISSAILKKEGPLNDSEWSEIKRHTLIGEEIISMIDQSEKEELLELKQIIGQHHERLNGSGYPRGLKGEEILQEARILAVADTYNAMTSARPYRRTLSKDEALAEIRDLSGQHYDPEVVKCLMQLERR